MIQVSNVSKAYGTQVLLDAITFTIEPRERVGLIGRNGHGKSTLVKMFTGAEHQDSGDIIFPRDYRIGYLSQHLEFTESDVLAEACLALPLLDGCWKEIHKAEDILAGLGFEPEDLTKKPQALSGGYQIRLNLAKCLLTEPNLLLLDEPTNYLDIVSVRWLKRFLREWTGELLLITHDREFMDSIITHTIAIHRNKVRKATGTTDKMYELLAEEEELYENTRMNQIRKFRQSERFIERFRAQASKAKAVQSRIKQLDKIDRLEKRADIDTLEFAFRSADFPGKWVLNADEVSFSYLPEHPLIENLTIAVAKGDRIAIIGQNGKGKTTLLNLLAGETKPTEGEVRHNANTKIGYFGQTNVQRLNTRHTIEEEIGSCNLNLSRTAVRSIAGLMMFEGDSALKKISVLSGGERSRVLLAKILVSPANLLLLDEPTHHLDIDSVESLMDAIDSFPEAVIVVTHSEMILRRLATRLIVFDGPLPEVFEGTYDEFLRRRGWAAEGKKKRPSDIGKSQSETPAESAPAVPANNSSSEEDKAAGVNSKEDRRLRAELHKILGPIRKKVQACETKIETAEAQLAEANVRLSKAVEGGDNGEIARYSWQVKDFSEAIERGFAELETASKELENATAENERKLGLS